MPLSAEQEKQLLENVKSLTDHMTMVDKVFKAARLGVNMELVFQCGHSGLYYPGNYVKEWGKLYGIGLGPFPVSECLDTDYDTDPPEITTKIRSLNQIMHPLQVTCAQVDYLLVERSEFQKNKLILAQDDELMEERAPLIRTYQLENPKGKLRNMAAAWEKAGRKVTA